MKWDQVKLPADSCLLIPYMNKNKMGILKGKTLKKESDQTSNFPLLSMAPKFDLGELVLPGKQSLAIMHIYLINFMNTELSGFYVIDQ